METLFFLVQQYGEVHQIGITSAYIGFLELMMEAILSVAFYTHFQFPYKIERPDDASLFYAGWERYV